MTRGYSFRTITELKPGAHLCCLYSTEEEHQAVLTPFLRRGLEQGEKVLYIMDINTAKVILGYLRAEGLEVDPYLARGQLGLLSVTDAYMRDSHFNPDGMIALLRTETERALAEGYTALRVTGEMTWALRGQSGADQLIEYEAKLNTFFPGSQCLAICQYDQRRFDPAVLLEALVTHPTVVIGTEVFDNIYYIPPTELLGPNRLAATLCRWRGNLATRKQTEAALRAERDKAQKYLDVAGVAIIAIDADQKVTLVNKKGCDVLGYTEAEILGKNWFDTFLPERIRDEIKAVFQKLMAGELEPVEYYENPVLTKSGEERLIAWHNTVLTDEGGKIIGTLSSGEDITERKRAEAMRRDLEERRLNFIEITSHELRTPLTIIRGHMELLAQRWDEFDQNLKDRCFNTIHRNIRRLERLIAGVSTLRQIERGSLRLDMKEIDFCNILTEAMQSYRTILGQQLEFRSCHEGGPVLIIGDADRLLQVLDNLLENAVKYTPQDRRKIIVTSEIRPPTIRLQVTDNGAGITPEDLERIFEPFTVIPTSYSAGGTGIGLFLARRIVEAHGGTLTAHSKGKGLGTTFVLETPRKRGRPIEGRARTKAPGC